jgi:AcrR family transcriptional regulator
METELTAHRTLSPRRQRNHDAMVDSILETSRAIMREQGVAALSMQELARRLDMRAPSLYHYFGSKMDIYDALFRMGFRMYAEHNRASIVGAETWQEEIRQSFEAYMTFAMHNPDLYQLCFERPVPGFIPSAESLQVSFGLLKDTYRHAAHLMESMDTDLAPEQMVDLVIAFTHGLTALHMANEPHLPLGQGRFGSLIPAAMTVLSKAWSKS